MEFGTELDLSDDDLPAPPSLEGFTKHRAGKVRRGTQRCELCGERLARARPFAEGAAVYVRDLEHRLERTTKPPARFRSCLQPRRR